MHWFIVALGAPLVWSLINHCDKLILSRYFKGGGSGALMVFVAVIALPLSIGIWIFNPNVLDISLTDALVLIASGLLYNLGVLLYLKVLEYEETSLAIPFWQLTPVFAYIFGVIFLHEYLAPDKLLGAIIVILGAVLLTVKIGGEKIIFHKKTAILMTLSSAILALGYVFFKDSEGGAFWDSMFWNQVGMFIFGAACYLVPSYRREFVDALKQNSFGVLVLNIAEQLLEVVGIFINNYALLLAPAALVMLVEYTAQPLFVFIEGVVLTLLFPKLVEEDLSRANILRKFVSIAIMTIGLIIIVK